MKFPNLSQEPKVICFPFIYSFPNYLPFKMIPKKKINQKLRSLERVSPAFLFISISAIKAPSTGKRPKRLLGGKEI